MTDKRKFWWSEVSKWDDHVEKGWIQWIELVAGLSAMIALTLSLLAVWTARGHYEPATSAIARFDASRLASHSSRRCKGRTLSADRATVPQIARPKRCRLEHNGPSPAVHRAACSAASALSQ